MPPVTFSAPWAPGEIQHCGEGVIFSNTPVQVMVSVVEMTPSVNPAVDDTIL